MKKELVAQKVVDRIVSMIESEGSLPWIQPWSRKPDTIKVVDGHKIVTVYPRAWGRDGHVYRGINTYLPPGEYITFHRCQEEGGHVKKGAKGFPIIGSGQKVVTETDHATEEEKERVIAWVKAYTVFSIDDCEGIEQKHNPKPIQYVQDIYHYESKQSDNTLNDEAESIVSDYIARAGNGFNVRRDEITNRAFYSPSADYVSVPCRAQFDSMSEYYSTLFHELGHSTGHESRLNRFDGSERFGNESYSREELVAEATAASILNALGMEEANTFRNSAAYIQGWSEYIKNDPMMFAKAMSKAQEAFELIAGIRFEEDGKNES